MAKRKAETTIGTRSQPTRTSKRLKGLNAESKDEAAEVAIKNERDTPLLFNHSRVADDEKTSKQSTKSKSTRAKNERDAFPVPEVPLIEDEKKPRAINKRKKARGSRRGILQEMPNMPVDILVEIFAYLGPQDMLSLSRSTRDFRAFLFDRSTAPFWKAARRNVGDLPAIPDDMSEPAFAHLFFDKFCHNCLKPNAGEMYWILLGRFCRACLKDATTNVDNTHYMEMEIKGRKDKTIVHIPVPSVNCHNPRYGLLGYRTLSSEWESTLKRWNNVQGDESLEQAFIEQERTRCDQREKNAELWAAWEERRKLDYEQQLAGYRFDRLRNVLRILEESGWGPEVVYMGQVTDRHPLFDLPFIRLSRPWGPQSWVKVQVDVIAVVQKMREERLVKERKECFHIRRKHLQSFIKRLSKSFGIVSPHEREFVEFPEIRDLINAPADQIVTQGDFDALKFVIRNHMTVWRKNTQQKILKEFCKQADIDIPDYAAAEKLALFNAATCSSAMCGKNILPAEMFAHDCFHSQAGSTARLRFLRQGLDTTEYSRWLDTMLHSSPWVPAMHFRVQRVKKVLELCGKDPLTTTAEALDRSDVRFCCNACINGKDCYSDGPFRGSQLIFTWRSLIQHDKHVYEEKGHVEDYALVHPEDAKQVASLEVTAIEKSKQRINLWYCNLCPKKRWCSTHKNVVEHLAKMHNVTQPLEEHLSQDSSAYSSYPGVYLIQKGVFLKTVHRDAWVALREGNAVVGQIHSPVLPS
ncbi:hypothetical protein K474DRAFT_1776866 [Panus rudis PR-1116 ss-1]|nr:hypothetical protein K474DRAFT_1776866 [Panus rudis PR-1116 ss-1]